MKKLGTKAKGLIILAVAVAMIATTAISLVFWSTGVSTPSEDHGRNITIGQGNSIDTMLTFDKADNADEGGRLVPLGVQNKPGEVSFLEFTIVVTWEPSLSGDNAGISDDIVHYVGNLTVSTKEILIGTTNFANATGKDNQPLFIVTINVNNSGGTTSQIRGGSDTEVVIRVEMNQPRDREQYLEVANATAELWFTFAVSGTDYQPLP